MLDSRRRFIAALSGILLSGKGLLKASQYDGQDYPLIMDHVPAEQQEQPAQQVVEESLLLPPALSKGSRVAITAPASPASMGELRYALKVFKDLGCEVIIGDTLTKNKNKFNYFSAPDEDRATEFMNFIEDDKIDAILCARGGYGVMHILPLLDFSVIRNNPKIVIGFSDITGLINSIYSISRLVSFHGPVAVSSFDSFTVANLTRIVFENKKFEPLKGKYPDIQVLIPGQAEGRLVGGNLSLVASTLGTPFEIDTRDSILFLEEVSEEPYKIDRMLTQLWLAGKLQACKGIIFGNFDHLDTKRHFFPNMSFTVRQIIEARIKPLGIPSYLGLPVGHVKNNLTLPIGINVEMDTKDKSFVILESPVKI
jgi:muramoyltetrapeptide carboxypeptidase